MQVNPNEPANPPPRLKVWIAALVIALTLYVPQTPCFFQWLSNSGPPWAWPGLPAFLPVELLFRWVGWSRQVPESVSEFVAIVVTLMWAAGLLWLNTRNRKWFWAALIVTAGLSSFFSFVLLAALKA